MMEKITIGRCKDCRYGCLSAVYECGPLKGRENHEYPWGTCSHDNVLNGFGDNLDEIYEWEAAETKIGPMFGCVHWEAKGCSQKTGVPPVSTWHSAQ